MAELHVLRVFVAPEGTGGNPLGVFLDGAAVPEGRRQAVAADLGFSETVFVDDPRAGRVRIFTPAAELAAGPGADRGGGAAATGRQGADLSRRRRGDLDPRAGRVGPGDGFPPA